MLLITLLSISSCNGLTIPDVPVCKELLPFEAYCTWTMSNKSQFVNDKELLDGKTWWEIRKSVVSVPAESYLEQKKFFLKACEKYPKVCKEYDVKSTIENIDNMTKKELKK